jgi:hypothetical protein
LSGERTNSFGQFRRPKKRGENGRRPIGLSGFNRRKFVIQLSALIAEVRGIQRNAFDDFQQGVDFSLGREKFVYNHDLLIPQNAVAGLEIPFFIPKHVIRFGNQILQFGQELIRIFDHEQVRISGKMHLNSSIFNLNFSRSLEQTKSASFRNFGGVR